MPEEKDSFVALGPNLVGFRCHGANLDIGGYMEGTFWGLYSRGLDPGPEPVPFPNSMGLAGTARDGPGVVGTTSDSHGVYGAFGDPIAPVTQAAGVCGAARGRNPFGKAVGVVGQSGTESTGVIGQSGDPVSQPPGPTGVYGVAERGFGVVGLSPKLTGVLGLSDRFAGVFGASNQHVGVAGHSQRSSGILGVCDAPMGPDPASAPAGVFGLSTNGSIGVLGIATQTPGAGIVGIGSADANAGVFRGNVVVTGQIFAGIKDAIVPFPDGSTRLLHCMESPEHWFEDFGSARLTRGRATVKLDADFAKVVKLNGYRVFLTPEGDCQGLYVRRRGTSFEVHELQGGTSNVAFSYRIVAKRKDIKAHTRFAKIDTTVPVPTGKPRAARGRKAARLPSSIRKLLAATAVPIPTGKVRAPRRPKAARVPSSIRKLFAEQKRARKVRRKSAR